jgi:hypothetical protein
MRELFFAIKYTKFIIPIFIPESEKKATPEETSKSLGWSGPGEGIESWWQHAQRKCNNDQVDVNGTKETINFRALEKFKPIDMRGEKQMEGGSVAEGNLVTQITSRFHRSVMCCSSLTSRSKNSHFEECSL